MDDAPVELIEDDVLGLWVSSAAGDRPSPERLRAHERVVRQALRSATPLPLRYGSTFAGRDEAATVLRDRRDEFAASLDRLAGRVEMGLRVTLPHDEAGIPPPPPTAGTPGRDYLRARKAALDAESRARLDADALLTEIEAELADLALPAARTVVARGGFVGSLAHLLHREEVPRYRKRASRLQSRRPDLRITVTGPWAPYSFV